MNMARRLDTRQQWSSSNNISQSGNNKNTQLTFTKVVEILVEDFIGPLLCFGQNCRGNVKSKRHHPYGTNRTFSRKAKSLMSDEEGSTASTDVDSYYEEESVDTRDYDPTAPLVRQRRERIVCDDSSINDELTDPFGRDMSDFPAHVICRRLHSDLQSFVEMGDNLPDWIDTLDLKKEEA